MVPLLAALVIATLTPRQAGVVREPAYFSFASGASSGYSIDLATQSLHQFGSDGEVHVVGRVPLPRALWCAINGKAIHLISASGVRMRSALSEPSKWKAESPLGFSPHRVVSTSFGLLMSGDPKGSGEFQFEDKVGSVKIRGSSRVPPVLGDSAAAFMNASGAVAIIDSKLSVRQTPIKGRPLGIAGDRLIVEVDDQVSTYTLTGKRVRRLPSFTRAYEFFEWAGNETILAWIDRDLKRLHFLRADGTVLEASTPGSYPRVFLAKGKHLLLLTEVDSGAKTNVDEVSASDAGIALRRLGTVNSEVNLHASGTVGGLLFLAKPFGPSISLRLDSTGTGGV